MRTLSRGSFLENIIGSFLLAFAAAAILAAQSTGTILGTVKDQSGAVLPGATVTASNTETGIARSSVSGSRGEYRIPALAVGNYNVEATMSGFQTGVRQGITLSLGREAVVDFTLQVGNVAEQVTVTGEAPLIETTSATVSGLVDPKQMLTIPLNARSFIELVPLQAGAIFADSGEMSATKGFGRKLSITGTRYNQNSFLLDGADINDATSSAGSAANTLAGVETVREFRVITNAYDAQYGRHTGGVISAVTKSGTNSFHGSVFEYLRNIAMDAAKWEDNARNNGQKPPFRRNQFGGSLGGPIIKDRTFFFGSYEGLRQQQGATNPYNVPSLAARIHGVANGGLATIDPTIKPYLDVFPLPNVPGFLNLPNGTGQYSVAQNTPTNENYVNVRGDHHFSDSDSFFGRYNMDRADSFNPNGVNTGAQSKTATLFATISDTHIFSPTLLSQTLFSYNRTRIDLFDKYLPGGELPGYNFVGDKSAPGIIGVSNTSGLGGSSTNPKLYIQNNFQFTHDMTWTKGQHSLKFGGQFERLQFNQVHNPFYLPGEFDFSGVTQFLQKQVNQAHFVMPGSDDYRGWRQNVTGLYVQDDINLMPSFTLNLGIRYEFISVPKEVNGKVATVRDLSPAHFYSIDFRGTDTGDPYFLNPSLKNFAPRVGFAWTPFSSGKTSVRGGAGEFHDQLLPTYYQTAGARIPPYFAVAEFFNTTVQNLTGGQNIDFPNMFSTQRALLAPGNGVQPQLDGFQFKVSQPAVYKWSLNIQQQLAGDTTLEVGYSGTRATHLVRGNLNLNATPGRIINGQQFILITSSPITLNPNLGRMRWRLTDGDSIYHGLLASFKKRFSRGFQMQSSYTYSRSIDTSSTFTGSSDFSSADRTNYLGKRERGLSAFDVTQSFFTNFVYDLPGQQWSGITGQILGGWSLSGNLRLSSGNPINLTALQPQFGSFTTNYVEGSTLNLISGGIQNRTTGTTAGCGTGNAVIPAGRLGAPDRYFDPCQFASVTTNQMNITPASGVALNDSSLPVGFFLGTVGRNILRSPGVASLDGTLSKNTKLKWLGEAGGVEFRAEFYNLLNRPNFGYPALSVFTRTGAFQTTAGQITTTRFNSRQIQLALRIVF